VVDAYALSATPLVFAGSADWAGAVEDPSAVNQIDFPFVAHGSIQWGIEVRNNLGLPISIEGLHPGSIAPAGPVADEQLHLLREGATEGVDPNLLRPFIPTQLEPGQLVFLAVTGEFLDCATARHNFDPGSGSGQDRLLLDVSILGIARVAEVHLPFEALYEAPTVSQC
jgi:hypothetical protein